MQNNMNDLTSLDTSQRRKNPAHSNSKMVDQKKAELTATVLAQRLFTQASHVQAPQFVFAKKASHVLPPISVSAQPNVPAVRDFYSGLKARN